MIETEVEVGVAEMIAQFQFVRLVPAGGSENLFGRAATFEKGVDFPEGNTAVTGVGVHLFAGVPDRAPLCTHGADEVPDGILHVGAVDGLVNFELCHPILVSPGVIERDPTLPVVGCLPGHHLDHTVPVLQRFRYATSEEVLGSAAVEEVRAAFLVRRAILGGGGQGECGGSESGQKESHVETFTIRTPSCNAQGG